MRKKLLGVAVVTAVFVMLNSAEAFAKVYKAEDALELSGSNAPVWQHVENGDVIDISSLAENEIGDIYVPNDVTDMALKGSNTRVYSRMYIHCEKNTKITLENIICEKNLGSAFFEFTNNSQGTINIVGTNRLTAQENSKCVIGNVKFTGDGSLVLKGGMSADENNLAHCILGNVVFDTSGEIEVVSADGKNGTASSIGGVGSGDAIRGNVECKNTGNVTITAGDGGRKYLYATSGGTESDGGSGIRGNLICSDSVTVNVTGGSGSYLGLRTVFSIAGKSGDGVCGDVVLKKDARAVITGGENRKIDNANGCGVRGKVKMYDNSFARISGGCGGYAQSSRGGYGGDGIHGSLSLFDNAQAEVLGAKASSGDSGNSTYPSSYGDGGVGGCAVRGDVYLAQNSTLSAVGGNGGNGGHYYTSQSTPSSGTSSGGEGGSAIIGDVALCDNASLRAVGGVGGNGGKAKTSNGGNGGDAVIGAFSAGERTSLVAKGGKSGTKYYLQSGTNGRDGRDFILLNTPILSGGYVSALFFDEAGKATQPCDGEGTPIYKTVAKMQGDFDGKIFEVMCDGEVYMYAPCVAGECSCYLPNGKELVFKYDGYVAEIPYVWEDNSTIVYLEPKIDSLDTAETNEIEVTSYCLNGKTVFFAKARREIKSEMLHIAIYNDKNVLVDYIIVPTTEGFNHINVVFETMKEASFAKVFLWNGSESLEPLAEESCKIK